MARRRDVVAMSPRHRKPSSALADDTQAGGAARYHDAAPAARSSEQGRQTVQPQYGVAIDFTHASFQLQPPTSRRMLGTANMHETRLHIMHCHHLHLLQTKNKKMILCWINSLFFLLMHAASLTKCQKSNAMHMKLIRISYV